MTTTKDCDKYGDEEVCADAVVDVDVDQIIPHKEYDKDKLKNDIALIKTSGRINFTGSIYYIHIINLSCDLKKNIVNLFRICKTALFAFWYILSTKNLS